MRKVSAAIVGSGNIATDLMEKLRRSESIDLRFMVGIDPASAGLARAKAHGIETSDKGLDWLLARADRPDLVFEATSAAVHARQAPCYRAAGIRVVDLTPAACGPYVVPPVNLTQHLEAGNVNLVTCGGQATVPMVAAVSRVVQVDDAEIVATVASKSAGPGTRANIDEFTRVTARALEVVGGAGRGKAIIILNPADPPFNMRNTIFCSLPEGADQRKIEDSIREMEAVVRTYVPGYRLRQAPQFDDRRVSIFVEVEGAGDFFPPYAGNLDIMTAAAARVGEEIARSMTMEGVSS